LLQLLRPCFPLGLGNRKPAAALLRRGQLETLELDQARKTQVTSAREAASNSDN
jgi:hypothetical protein